MYYLDNEIITIEELAEKLETIEGNGTIELEYIENGDMYFSFTTGGIYS